MRRRVNPRELLRTLSAVLGALDLRAGAPTLLTIPLFHGHGLMTLGLCLTLRAPLHLTPRGSAAAFLHTLDTGGIEVLVVVPTVLRRLLGPEAGRAGALRAIVCGSAPLAPELATRALRHFGPVLFNVYGSSEGGLILLACPGHLLAAPDSVGPVLPGVHVTVRRKGGAPAAPGEVGEVWVRGDMTQAQALAQGPRGGDLGTGELNTGEHTGELNTGDLGHLTSAGWLTLAGRQDDLLICGGENVLPEQVEARLQTLPYVRDCAVAGVPCEEYGQALVAFVVLEPGAAGEACAARVMADLRRLLPRALRPVRVSFVPHLPRNAVGKLVRRHLPV